MRDYFIRRLLLIPPTLIGVTIIVFAITRIVPGGPLERAIMESQQLGGSYQTSLPGQDMAISEDQLERLKEYYGFDKPLIESYFNWLGKILRGDLGTSYRYNEPVWDVIKDRFPISLYYGLVTLTFTYLICIPLAIVKAIKHKTMIDNVSSFIDFYRIRDTRICARSLLLLYFSVYLEWFPMGGFVSMSFDDKNFIGKISDLVSHSVLPLICYLIGSFALVTLLLKNHLMDNLASDYIRQQSRKGCHSNRPS